MSIFTNNNGLIFYVAYRYHGWAGFSDIVWELPRYTLGEAEKLKEYFLSGGDSAVIFVSTPDSGFFKVKYKDNIPYLSKEGIPE